MNEPIPDAAAILRAGLARHNNGGDVVIFNVSTRVAQLQSELAVIVVAQQVIAQAAAQEEKAAKRIADTVAFLETLTEHARATGVMCDDMRQRLATEQRLFDEFLEPIRRELAELVPVKDAPNNV